MLLYLAAILCFYILPSGRWPIVLDQMSGRKAYASIFGIRALSLCFCNLPSGRAGKVRVYTYTIYTISISISISISIYLSLSLSLYIYIYYTMGRSDARTHGQSPY